MNMRMKHWRTAVVASLLAVAGVALVQPAADAKKKQKKPTTYFFYEGTAANGNAVAWMAKADKPQGKDPVYGLAGAVDLLSADAQAARLVGSQAGAKITGKLLTAKGKSLGSFAGQPNGTTLQGTFQVDGEPSSNWTVTEVVKNGNDMAALAGHYTVGSLTNPDVRVEVDLDGVKGTIGVRGFLDDGQKSRKLVELQGRWIADTNSALWILVTSLDLKLPDGVSASDVAKFLKLPKDGKVPTVLKAGYTLNSDGSVDLLNPFDSTQVLATLAP